MNYDTSDDVFFFFDRNVDVRKWNKDMGNLWSGEEF
jgi:hypothetical protein